ncbi:hypothetical protein SCHPADRAFT_230571 [Schizopora paradoxa]|uniref:Uncharacterized protein n=1 Tax=Schizopora paradoxa TaxID=27342 RepID=A0A0H2SGE2_9AGAM|nr:hypothetical protein SCHPADRAFT_230571 [Schizopora paradoxa]
MVSSPSSTPSKGQSVSYAERAKRASSSTTAMAQSNRSLSTTTSNGNTQSSTESNSPSTSSRNLTPSSSVILTRPDSTDSPPAPTNGSAFTETEKEASLPVPPKSPSKPPPNVWAARKEQMAQRAAAAAAVASAQPTSPTKSVEGGPTSRPQIGMNKSSLKGNNNRAAEVVAPKSQDDPFVVRLPAQSQNSAPILPNLDDAESWPEMGKAIANSGAFLNADTEKKDVTSSSSTQPNKRGEKTKWVAIPPAELQAASDASQSSSRAHSQNRRHQKSHSRQHSQSRNIIKQTAQHQPQRQNAPRDSRVGSAEVSVAHSRADSVIHSRATSQHSSPMHGARGRKLPEDAPATGASNIVSNLLTVYPPGTTNAIAGPSSVASNSGNVTRNYPNQGPGIIYDGQVRTELHGLQSGPQSRTHSQPHTPFDSRSPAYHSHPSTHEYRGGSPSHGMYPVYPMNGGYPITVMPLNSQDGLEQPQNANMPPFGGFLPVHQHQQAFVPPYLYQPVPYGYLPPPHMHGQGPHPQFEPQVMTVSTGYDAISTTQDLPPPDVNLTEHSKLINLVARGNGEEVTEPNSQPHFDANLPPSSLRSRPAPPEESEALSGYRRIPTFPVSPLLNPLGHTHLRKAGVHEEGFVAPVSERGERSESSEGNTNQPGDAWIFGSVRPGGIKSPSPVTSPASVPLHASSSLGLDVGEAPSVRKGTYSVGFQGTGLTTIRIKARRSGRDPDRRSLLSAMEGLSASQSTSSEGAQTAASGDSVEETRADAHKYLGVDHVGTEERRNGNSDPPFMSIRMLL